MTSAVAKAGRSIGGALLALALAACASGLDDRSDLERTWQAAYVTLPPFAGADPVAGRLADVGADVHLAALGGERRWPVIVYLHGCTGIGSFDFFDSLARAGFVVIAPDSMARRYRPLQCNPRTRTGGYNLFVYDFRQAEISFSLQQLLARRWADPDNLFLMGVSEGAVAAALYRGDSFRARVIAQWTCQGAPLVRGIDAPPETPILAVVRVADPWYDAAHTIDQHGNCGEFMQGRPGSRSIVADGNHHDILSDPALVEEIVAFLEGNRH